MMRFLRSTGVMALALLGVPFMVMAAAPIPVTGAADPMPDHDIFDHAYCAAFRFSTEIGFTEGSPPHFPPRSDGDLLSTRGCLVLTNNELTANLGIMPVVPDLGLDAATSTFRRPVLFSLEQSVFSETLGRIGHGDLLATDGRIVRTNHQLLEAFDPWGPCPCISVDGDCDCDCTFASCPCGCCDVGLDAAHVEIVSSADRRILFSVEHRFWSEALGQWVSHGDLLSDTGAVFRTNQQLMANFHALCPDCPDADCECDFGLDAVYLTRWGTVWFSVEQGFYDVRLGWISDGALLSENGWVVRRNLQLLHSCAPLEDLANFGLDAVDFRIHGLPASGDVAEPLPIDTK